MCVACGPGRGCGSVVLVQVVHIGGSGSSSSAPLTRSQSRRASESMKELRTGIRMTQMQSSMEDLTVKVEYLHQENLGLELGGRSRNSQHPLYIYI